MNDRIRQIKDPIYGYIYLPDGIVQSIVDTPEFQRLRKITQTSYEALYPSATHNRFAHSLGVFHLSTLVAKAIELESLGGYELDDSQSNKYREYLETYKLACLLHDVGHAPFSHTSEDFYIAKTGRQPLHERIAGLANDPGFVSDAKSAAPHELMSVVVGLEKFGALVGSDAKKSFFARAITGYKYNIEDYTAGNAEGVNYSFLNALISLLNSKVVDVDRMDYLIRDAFQTGYESVNIDYERLLGAVRIKKNKNDGSYNLVFSKDALSVLENAVYAHDAEKKWIQTHLSICYETYLLENAIKNMMAENDLKDVEVFGEESLSESGIALPSGYRLRLMSDGDITFLLKNHDNDFTKEYFNRSKRKHPLWKTEHEYRSYFQDARWTEFFGDFAKCDWASAPSRINSSLLNNCQENVANRQKALDNAAVEEREQCQAKLKFAQRMLARVEKFKEFAAEIGAEFDFVVLDRRPFESGFNRKEFEKLQIEVRGTDKTVSFRDATEVLSRDAKDSDEDETYYLFWKKFGTLSSVDAIKKLKDKLSVLL